MMTPAATRFITPLTFEALLNSPVVTDLFQETPQGPSSRDAGGGGGRHSHRTRQCRLPGAPRARSGRRHRELHRHGVQGPCRWWPPQCENMYLNAATQANIALLRERGAVIIGPESGELASGGRGAGRMSTIETIVGWTLKTSGTTAIWRTDRGDHGRGHSGTDRSRTMCDEPLFGQDGVCAG